MPVDAQKDQDTAVQHGANIAGHNAAVQHGADAEDRDRSVRLCWRCENVLRQKGVILKRTDNHAICQHVICSVCKRYAGGGDFQIMGQLDKQTVKKRGVW